MSWEQRNHDFSTAQVDAQVAYIEAEREVKRLQTENDKLRKQVANLIDCGFQMADKVCCFNDENNKLRELVRDSASLLDATCDTYYEDDYHAIIDRMRELGVEVDG